MISKSSDNIFLCARLFVKPIGFFTGESGGTQLRGSNLNGHQSQGFPRLGKFSKIHANYRIVCYVPDLTGHVTKIDKDALLSLAFADVSLDK